MSTRARLTTAALGGAAAAALTVAATTSAPALAAAPPAEPVQVVLDGLNGNFGIDVVGRTGFVAESGAGQVTQGFASGRKRVVFDGVPGVSAVAAGKHRLFAVLGGGAPPDEGAPPPPPSGFEPTSVLRATYDGRRVEAIANLEDYELRENPDGQDQFDEDGNPHPDALSNPFGMSFSKRLGLLVADGGANDVLQVNPRTGRVRTFFVPPAINVPGCVQANPGTVGCDPVPTGVDIVGDYVYVSTLGAETPGAARIYKLNRWGKVVRTWRNVPPLTGVAAAPNGTVFASTVFAGQVLRISPNGRRSVAEVPSPTGLDYDNGRLFVSAGVFGPPGGGQVVWVRPSAFG